MDSPFAAFGVLFAASFVWLIVRIINRREKWAIDLAIWLAIAAALVSIDGFRIKSVGRWGSSFAPELFGQFECRPDGTCVHIETIPSSGALAVVAVMTAAIGLMIFYSGLRVYPAIAGEVLAAWLFSISGFWLDAGTSRRMLVEILNGQRAETLDE